MRLIITEKNNSAKKIADILSGGEAKADATYKVPFYTWSDAEGDQMAVGLKGHVMGVAFPEGYSNWQETDLHELIDAELVPEPTDKNVVKAVRKLAKDADSMVIATDYDREGELIGLEALQQVLDVNPEVARRRARRSGPPVKRARYSALTKEEIERAFSNLDELSYDLAYAGSARQDIDLIWGATLTRAVSLATRRFGSNFLSVGRVQSPTLALIVERELERRAHVAKPYWELFAKFAHPDGSFEAHHTTDKFWDRAEADAALGGTKSPGVVKEVSSQEEHPQATDALQHHRLHHRRLQPARDHPGGRDADRRGPLHGRVHLLSAHRQHRLSELAEHPRAGLLAGRAIPTSPRPPACSTSRSCTATRGKKETTDHPPIYPTQAVYPNALEGPKRRVYELVVRRFLATFSPPMITESTRADIEAGSETYFVRGSVVVDPGYAAIYTYARSADEEIPKLEEGQELTLDGEPWIVDKETQPPSRISQGKLIELMEERGLGTKATRADIIQKLYDRGYVFSNPPEPSETGIAMYKAFHEYVPRMATPEMTAELERDMDQIAAGEISKEEVVRISREMLHGTTSELRSSARSSPSRSGPGWTRTSSSAPARSARRRGASTRTARPNRLRIIDMRGGKRFWGCEGYEPRRPRRRRTRARSAARSRAAAMSSGGSRSAARSAGSAPADRQGLPRPAMEAVPERRLPDDGRDAREARRAPGGAGGA